MASFLHLKLKVDVGWMPRSPLALRIGGVPQRRCCLFQYFVIYYASVKWTPHTEKEFCQTMPRSILYGKLNRPRSGVKTLERARLCQQIDKSLDSHLTTVVAPAGYGKTVLLASWMAQHPSLTAWLSLDVNDNQLLTFVRYLALAIEALFPNGCRETLSLVEALFPPTLAQLTDCLLSEIGDLPGLKGREKEQGYFIRSPLDPQNIPDQGGRLNTAHIHPESVP